MIHFYFDVFIVILKRGGGGEMVKKKKGGKKENITKSLRAAGHFLSINSTTFPKWSLPIRLMRSVNVTLSLWVLSLPLILSPCFLCVFNPMFLMQKTPKVAKSRMKRPQKGLESVREGQTLALFDLPSSTSSFLNPCKLPFELLA